MKKKIAALFGFFVVVIAVVLVVNTLRMSSLQIDADPVADIPMNEIAAAERLAAALRIQTISHENPDDFDGDPFLQFHMYLEETFPTVHSTLTWETVNEYSLLYRWEGSDPSLSPIALLAHIDVVPVEPGTEEGWTYGAYDGRIEDGFIWGRGALDMKNILVGTMEAVEMLLAEGVQPRRTIYLAFGHDEEVGGQNGAVAIAALLQSRGIRLDHVLDEGGAIADGLVPGIEGTVALVGIAEKGFANIRLVAHGEPGHASMPPEHTAAGLISRAVYRLENNPFPVHLTKTVRAFLKSLIPYVSYPLALVFSNLWLFAPVVKLIFKKNTKTAAMVRTTQAATILDGSKKDNILPDKAEAIINVRILPGEIKAEVM